MGTWLALVGDDFLALARRLSATAELAGDDGADANYWFMSASSRSNFQTVPTEMMVSSLVDDLAVLRTLDVGAAPEAVHLEAMASILLHLAARAEQP